MLVPASSLPALKPDGGAGFFVPFRFVPGFFQAKREKSTKIIEIRLDICPTRVYIISDD